MRDLLLVALLAVVALKLLNADVKIDLASFSFNDFLALVLALFSVALSVAFYFKANEASNQFYDNTYKFTKDMSEILGRIEAGFGERLRHLDEGYSGMRDRLDKLPHYGATPADVKAEEEEIKLKEAEQRAVLEDLAERAKLAEHEKQALFANLEQKNEELEQARMELRRMHASRQPSGSTVQLRADLAQYLGHRLAKSFPPDSPITSSKIRRTFAENKFRIADEALQDMRDIGLIGSDDELTRDGVMVLQAQLKRMQLDSHT
ncbi:hypothetical protein HTX81_16125 [Pseudomonas lini]|uniref:hypothetical protein n=1 Tax=Pseudomonas lini TaxID=163011 RepID=UPI001574421B|nr:hypothetical protein [Pseudomonas lini]NSX10112.1 hypothetical protein [Pseudomonas lini]